MLSLGNVSATTMVAAPLNVLMIAVDDMRLELSCYGAKQFTSGKIRRYAMADGQSRYVEWVETSNREKVVARELYDRVEDSDESWNLADETTAQSELVQSLSAKLNRGRGWKDARPPR